MRTLMSEMQAVDTAGNIDHKTRMAALKEARAFVQSILPRLTEEDRGTFSHSMASEMKSKLALLIQEEERLKALPDAISQSK